MMLQDNPRSTAKLQPTIALPAPRLLLSPLFSSTAN